MITEVDAARRAALERVSAATTLDGLGALHTELLGRRSDLAALKQRLGSLDPADRKAAGQAVNNALADVEIALSERHTSFADAARQARIAAERLDLTEVFDSYRPGAATSTSSPRPTNGSRTSSSAWASPSPKGPRSRPTGTTSRP